MKKRILLSLCFSVFCINQPCSAQKTKIDSLQEVLKTLKEDTGRANTLNNLGTEYYQENDLEQSIRYSREALLLSERIKYTQGKVAAFTNAGTVYYAQGNYHIAREKYDTALLFSRTLIDKTVIGNCYTNLGMIYSRQGNVAEALNCYQTGLKNYKEAGDQKGLARAYINLGNLYYEKGQYPEALQYYFSNLKMAEDAGDKKSIANVYNNIGMVYDNQDNSVTAMEYYEKAVKLYQEVDDKHGVASCYSYIANNYYRRDSVKTAIGFNRQAYALFEEVGDRAWASYVRNTMAQMNAGEGNYKQAIEDYTSSLKVFGEIGDTFNLFTSYQGLAGIYYKQALYQEAVSNLQRALAMAKITKGANNVNSCYRLLASVYETMKDYKNAYTYYKLYDELDDSLFNETKSQQIAEINTKYETEKKDQDIVLLNKSKELQDVEIRKQKLQKYSYIGVFGLAIILMSLGYRTYRIRQSLRLQDIRNKIAGDLHDDIGSTLNSISIYSEVARKKDEQQDEALEMIGEASRKIIDAMSDIVWTVNPDNDSFVKIIFRMKSLAYNLLRAKKIEFTFHSDENIDEKKLSLEMRRNFYLIFKEAVNNLVKYSNATRAAITLTNESDGIRLRIQDDGVGFDPSDEIIGNGLKNMSRRADEMNAHFKIESSKGNGTLIELKLKV